MATYQYEQLKEPRQIRLLSLLPGSTDELHFNLETANLDDNPKYEAISYCWGDHTDSRTVYCKDMRLQITVSLFTALRQLRLPDKHRALWADAVCINQDDDIEKSSQVKLMSLIYSKTSGILIWLGEDRSGLEGVRESITEALTFMPPDAYDAEEILGYQKRLFRDTAERRKQGKPNMHDYNWDSINRLLLWPWFGRKWIIQEVAMGSDSIPRLIMCGDLELSWSDLASLSYRLCVYGAMSLVSGLSILNDQAPPYMASFWIDNRKPMWMASNTFMTMLMKQFRSQVTILDCFIAAASFKCSKTQDHLYALISLPMSSGIEPDYTLSVEGVWERFAIKSLVDDQDLKFLALPSCMTRDESRDFPSWLPAIDGKILRNPFSSYTIKPQCFRAGGFATAPIIVSENNRQLHLTGRLIDTVKATTRGLNERPVPSPADVLPKTGFPSQVMMWKRIWFQECKDLAADSDWSKLVPDKRRAFFMTMMCGMTGLRDPIPQETIDALEVYFDYVAEFFTPGYTVSDVNWDTIVTHGAIIEHTILAFTSGLRFCTTDEGRFGQVNELTRPGDRICVLLGAEVPYILRPDEDTYRLIGQCYVHGVMQGETLTDEKYQNTPIVLL